MSDAAYEMLAAEQVRQLIERARARANTEPQRGLDDATTACEQAQRLGNPVLGALAQAEAGRNRFMLSDYEAAARDLVAAIHSFEAHGCHIEQADTARILGAVHRSSGDFGLALDSFAQAAALYRAGGSEQGAHKMEINIATIHALMGDWERAEPMFFGALPHCGDDPVARASCLLNLGVARLNRGRRHWVDGDDAQSHALALDAETYLLQAAAVTEAALPWHHRRIESALADALFFSGRHAPAIEIMARLAATGADERDLEIQTDALVHLGVYRLLSADPADWRGPFDAGLALAAGTAEKGAQCYKACRLVSAWFERRGDSAQALWFYKLMHEKERQVASRLATQRELIVAARAEQARMRADAEALRANARQLDDAAHRDALTELPNRRGLDRQLPRLLQAARDRGEPLAVAVGDIDRFKQINDSGSHSAGDAALRVLAARLRGCLRAGDVAARLGGDEFVLVLVGCDADMAVGALARLRVLLAAGDPEVEPPVDGFACSWGVTDASEPGDAAALLARADRALYAAKRQGGDRIERWSGAS